MKFMASRSSELVPGVSDTKAAKAALVSKLVNQLQNQLHCFQLMTTTTNLRLPITKSCLIVNVCTLSKIELNTTRTSFWGENAGICSFKSKRGRCRGIPSDIYDWYESLLERKSTESMIMSLF